MIVKGNNVFTLWQATLNTLNTLNTLDLEQSAEVNREPCFFVRELTYFSPRFALGMKLVTYVPCSVQEELVEGHGCWIVDRE